MGCGEGVPVNGSSMCKGPEVERRVDIVRSLNHTLLGSRVGAEGAADGRFFGRSAGARPRKALSATLQNLDSILRATGSKQRFQQQG